MKKLSKSPLVVAIGSAVLSSLAASNVQAEANPFGMSDMSQGYMQLAGVVPAEGAAPATEKPAAAAPEMKCGASMNMNKDAAAPATTEKKVDGSCGEGKCGAMMDGNKMKQGMEKVCGAMMKGKEGSCGNVAKDAAAPAPAAMGDMKGMEGMSDSKAKGEMTCGASMKKENGEMACGAMLKGGVDAKAVEGKCAGKK